MLAKQFPGRIQAPGRLPREQLLPSLAMAHVLVHPTFYEISPMAVLEAMALGLPVAASRIGPLPEIVFEPETGVLFKPGDEVALANSVLELLSANSNRMAMMGQAAVDRIEQFYNFNVISEQLLSFYDYTIKTSPVR